MKKKLLSLLLFIVAPCAIHAQVGIGVEDPHASAALEIVSKEKGLLISRITLEEKNAIQNPAESLLIYQTDGEVGFYYFDGSIWVLLKNIKQINADWNSTSGISEILNKPFISKAGISGDFNDLENIPAFVLASDTSKMLLPYLTIEKIQPFLDGKTSVADLNIEIARAIIAEEKLAEDLQTEVTRATSAESVLQGNIDNVKEKLEIQIKTDADKISTNTNGINSLNIAVNQNATSIDTLDTKVSKNTLDVQSNANNILTNAGDITILNLTVSQNSVDIITNTTGIQTNATNIALKENIANKSADGTLSDETDTKFPTAKAVKTYVDEKEIDLGNKATGILAITNGGTGSDVQNFMDLNSDQTIAGSKTMSSDIKVSGITVGVGGGDLESASYNTALGLDALVNNTGSANTAVGGNTMVTNTLGSQNTALGRLADVSNSNLNNATAIGFDAKVEASNTIQLGNLAVTDVKTSGTLTAGQVKYPNAHGTSGQVLSTTGTGLLTWITPSTATSATFVDLTSAQFISGVKTFRRRILLENESWGNRATMTMGFPRSGNNLSGLAIGINTLDKHQYGVHEIAIGNEALFNDLRGSYNIGIGYRALYNMTDVWGPDGHKWGNFNVGIGSNSGSKIIVGTHNTLIGSNSDTFADRINNATAIGNGAIVNASNTVQLGNGAITDVKTSGTLTAGNVTYPNAHGTTGQVLSTSGSGSLTWITPSSASSADFVDLTSNQTVAGDKTFSNNLNVKDLIIGNGTNGVASNTSIGLSSLVSNTAGINNVAIGVQAGYSITGSNNVAIGTATNRNATEGDNNIAIGNNANYQGTSGANNISLGLLSYRQGNSGSNNVALGTAALYNEGTGSNNIALGNESNKNGNGASGNITIGYRAGNAITTGNNNLILGYDADVSSGILSNATAIGNGAVVSASNTIQLGNSAVTDIKTSGKLTTGAITLPNLDGTSGQVLSTNGVGLVTWVTPSSASSSSFVDLISNQTVAGNKIFDNVKIVSNQSYPRTIFQVGGDNDFDYPLKYTQLNTDVTRLSFGFRGKEFRMKVNQNSGILDALTYSYFDGTTDKVAFQIDRNSSVTIGGVTYPNSHNSTAGQVLTTNASGVASWATPSTAAPIREVADEFTATASQTSFTLTQTPSENSKVKMYVNGIRISNMAYSVAGITLTYNPTNNGGNALAAGDRIQLDFYY